MILERTLEGKRGFIEIQEFRHYLISQFQMAVNMAIQIGFWFILNCGTYRWGWDRRRAESQVIPKQTTQQSIRLPNNWHKLSKLIKDGIQGFNQGSASCDTTHLRITSSYENLGKELLVPSMRLSVKVSHGSQSI